MAQPTKRDRPLRVITPSCLTQWGTGGHLVNKLRLSITEGLSISGLTRRKVVTIFLGTLLTEIKPKRHRPRYRLLTKMTGLTARHKAVWVAAESTVGMPKTMLIKRGKARAR